MTDRDRLIEAVEAGAWADKSDVQNFYRHCEVVFPKDDRELWIDAFNAYNGSLDAALRLHEALLPGWRWNAWAVGGATVWNDIANVHTAENSNPARAWLLAILRALKAKGDA